MNSSKKPQKATRKRRWSWMNFLEMLPCTRKSFEAAIDSKTRRMW
jgi:hypothetical protein